MFNRMNVAAVFAPKKVYGCSGYQGFNCDLKIQRAAATRTRLTDAGRLHGVPPWLGAVRRGDQIVPMKNAVCTGRCLRDTKFEASRKGGGIYLLLSLGTTDPF